MRNYQQCKLGDVVDSCLGKMLDQNKNKGILQPYLANVNVRWGYFDVSDLPLMRFQKEEDERYGLRYGDIVVCEGGEPGRCAIWKDQIPNMKIQKALHRIRVNANVIDFHWLFYWFLLAGRHNALEPYFTGSTIKHLPGDKLKQIAISLPELHIQQKVASILSAYDDAIENNNRRIKILEQLAENLYKEWFVRMRFPGHETAEYENSLPKGWTRGKIDVFYKTSSGGTPNRSCDEFFSEGTVPWIKTGELRDSVLLDTEEKITELAIKKSAAKRIPANSLLMAMYGVNIGQLGITCVEATCNQACCVFKDKQDFSTINYLFQYLKSIREYLLLIGFGAAQQNLSQDLIRRIKIIMPSSDVISRFEKKQETLRQQIVLLSKKNISLSRQRDWLLPRLMSGKMEVLE